MATHNIKRDAWLKEITKRGRKARLTNCGDGILLDDVYQWLLEAMKQEK